MAIPDLPKGSGPAQREVEDDQVKLGLSTEELLERLEGLSLSDQINLRTLIEQGLPARELEDMNLARELVLQTLALQQLQTATINDNAVKANQKAQVANSLSSSLMNLVKLQADVYTTERFKKVETILIEFLNAMPDSEEREEAFRQYELQVRSAFSA